jgi:hypothetical protein
MPHRMRGDILADAGCPHSPVAGVDNRLSREWFHAITTREQEVLRLRQLPVSAEYLKQEFGQADISVLSSLALAYANHHPTAVDIPEPERKSL